MRAFVLSLVILAATIGPAFAEDLKGPMEVLPVVAPVASTVPTKEGLLKKVKNHTIGAVKKTGHVCKLTVKTTVHFVTETPKEHFDEFCRVGKWGEKSGFTAGCQMLGAIGGTATPFVLGAFR